MVISTCYSISLVTSTLLLYSKTMLFSYSDFCYGLREWFSNTLKVWRRIFWHCLENCLLLFVFIPSLNSKAIACCVSPLGGLWSPADVMPLILFNTLCPTFVIMKVCRKMKILNKLVCSAFQLLIGICIISLYLNVVFCSSSDVMLQNKNII